AASGSRAAWWSRCCPPASGAGAFQLALAGVVGLAGAAGTALFIRSVLVPILAVVYGVERGVVKVGRHAVEDDVPVAQTHDAVGEGARLIHVVDVDENR